MPRSVYGGVVFHHGFQLVAAHEGGFNPSSSALK